MAIKLVIPEATTNLCTNPSLEKDLTGWVNSGMATFERTATWQAKGAWSLHAIANAASDALTAPSFTAINGEDYTISFRVNLVSGSWQLTIDGETLAFSTVGEQTLTISWQATSSGAKTPTFTCLSAAGELYIDAAQYEQKEYRTTFCDGTQYGCTWNANEHLSASARHSQARVGGREIDLETWFSSVEIDKIDGAGMPTLDHITQSAGIADGEFLQRIRSAPTVINLSCLVFADTMEAKHTLRRDIIDAIKPDKVFPLQPLLLIYDYSGKELEIECFYVRGMEGTLTAPTTWEEVTLQFVAYDPRWQSRHNHAVSLAPYTSIPDANNIIERRDGTWMAMGTGLNDDVNALIVDPSSGLLYVGGQFTQTGDGSITGLGGMASWDGNSFAGMGAGVGLGGGSNFGPEEFTLDSQGRLYIAGQFTAPTGGSAHITRWNGSAYESLSPGGAANARVRGIAISPDGTLYIGGAFTSIDGITVSKVARRISDGAWEDAIELADPNNDVTSLAISLDGNKLYVGGLFTSAFGLTTKGVLEFNLTTQTVSEMIAGLNEGVYQLKLTPTGLLYMVGIFTEEDPGSDYANQLTRVAGWNGSRYFGLGEGLGTVTDEPDDSEIVREIVSHPTTGELYAVGTFDMSGTYPAKNIARFNGAIWTPLDIVLPGNSPANSIAIDANGSRIFVGFSSSGTAVAASHTTVTNEGTSESYPVVVLNGPGVLRSIKNWTTGHEIFFPDLEIFEGETVTIDLRVGLKKVTSNKRGSLSSYVVPGGHMSNFSLLPGTNDISLLLHRSNDALPLYLGKTTVKQETGTSVVVSRVGGIQAGDLMVIAIALQGTATVTTLAGWTLGSGSPATVDGTGSNPKLYVFYRVATSPADTTATSYTFTVSANSRVSAAMVAYRQVDGTTPVDEIQTNTYASGSKYLRFAGATADVASERALYIAAGYNNDTASTVNNAAAPIKERVDSSQGASGTSLTLFIGDKPIAAASSIPADTTSVRAGGGHNYEKQSSQVVLLKPLASIIEPSAYMYWAERYWSADAEAS